MESNQDPIILLPHILSKPKKEDEIEEKYLFQNLVLILPSITSLWVPATLVHVINFHSVFYWFQL
jgi:hypothetical protein